MSRPLSPLVLIAAAAGALALLGGASELAALKAAGLTGQMPVGGAVIQHLISTLQQNWIWLVVTGVSLALFLVFGLMALGSQRAPDYAVRIGAGVAGILIVAPAILA